MIVAGVGCRKGVNADEVLAAIDAALAEYRLTRDQLTALATTAFKRDEAAIFEASRQSGLRVVIVELTAADDLLSPRGEEALIARAEGADSALPTGGKHPTPMQSVATFTRSAPSLATAGTPSVSESAALAAAGPGAQLLGPRTILGPVTCAIAVGGEP